MPERIKLTRPELKRYRDRLARCQRYLPMLKLKQQQLQIRLRDAAARRGEAQEALDEARARLARYPSLLDDRPGIPLRRWATPERVVTSKRNIAGIEIEEFADALFPEARYSLFGTPPWVDQALDDLRRESRCAAVVDVIRREEALLRRELRHVVQHVNLFEKVLIPRYRDAIRRIRIRLGDEMTAGIGRAKIAKARQAGGAAAGTEPPRRARA